LKFDNPLLGDEIVISVLGTTLMFECLEGNLKTSIILVSVLLAACAAPTSTHYAHWNSSTVSLESATAKCDDESSAALQTTELSNQGMFDQSLDEAFRKGDHLMAKCMKAQGYISQL
jgi:hypothetical protein